MIPARSRNIDNQRESPSRSGLLERDKLADESPKALQGQNTLRHSTYRLRALVSHSFVLVNIGEFGTVFKFFRSMSKRRKSLKLLKIIKRTFRNTTDSRAKRPRFIIWHWKWRKPTRLKDKEKLVKLSWYDIWIAPRERLDNNLVGNLFKRSGESFFICHREFWNI